MITEKDYKALCFAYSRLVDIYGEKHNVDYMIAIDKALGTIRQHLDVEQKTVPVVVTGQTFSAEQVAALIAAVSK